MGAAPLRVVEALDVLADRRHYRGGRRVRLVLDLGYVSPIEFELKAQMAALAA